MLEKAAGIDRRRTLPTFASDHFRKWFRSHWPDPRAGTRGTILLLDDCFTTYKNPEVGTAAVEVLEASGYRVELAGLTCCGRPAISKGLLSLAALAATNVRKLLASVRRGDAIVGCEPSCLVTLIDEYREFRLGAEASEVAAAAHSSRRSSPTRRACPNCQLPHGPAACSSTATVNRRHCSAPQDPGGLAPGPELEVKELDSGCCGMAGSFGYELGHYEVSQALANRVLIPAARAEPTARLVAPGFSCRSQVHGLADIAAWHPIQILAEQLRHSATGPAAQESPRKEGLGSPQSGVQHLKYGCPYFEWSLNSTKPRNHLNILGSRRNPRFSQGTPRNLSRGMLV